MKKKVNPYLQDYFAKRAKKENYLARSAFKLEEIQKKYRILKSGDRVLDLGASPGSWSQYAHKLIGSKGSIVGIDLTAISLDLPGATFIQADMLSTDLLEELESRNLPKLPFDVVLSDMAPKTTGVKFEDQMKSLELCELALDQSQKYLSKGGHFVCKLFHSSEFQSLKAQILDNFERFQAIKPQSTRSVSKEIFLAGFAKKHPPTSI